MVRSAAAKLIKKLDGLNRVLTDDDMDEDALLGILGKGFKGSSAKKVIDIWQTGTLQSLEDYRANEEFGALKCLSKIWGIGPATARKLYDATGARNVVELRSAVRLNPRLVQPNVHTTVSCHEDLQARMPRSEAAAIADRVKACAEKLFAELGNAGALSVTAAGSFRRGKEASRRPRRLRRSTTRALLYFTGSDHFNRSMRCFAKAKGFTLCDRGLRPTVRRGKATDSRGKYVDNKVAVGRPVEFEREEDVFAFLELPYKTPPERALDDNAAGIAAAAARRPQLSLWSGAK
ncbi:DNA-directed DNA polymerase [Aureococcus anophagefferens]|nr:DNA-directed DNA polymerase [Aureococcus anophagefferens]